MAGYRWFEDYIPGSVHRFGNICLTESEIIDFAKQFDPQPFHIDKQAGERSSFRGLVASGWHTASLTMRLLVENYLSEVSSLGSPGVDQLRWLVPVRPGDVLSVRATVLEARRSKSKNDRGIVRSKIDTLNEEMAVVMTFIATIFIRVRLDH